jgi:hypothetical protein
MSKPSTTTSKSCPNSLVSSGTFSTLQGRHPLILPWHLLSYSHSFGCCLLTVTLYTLSFLQFLTSPSPSNFTVFFIPFHHLLISLLIPSQSFTLFSFVPILPVLFFILHSLTYLPLNSLPSTMINKMVTTCPVQEPPFPLALMATMNNSRQIKHPHMELNFIPQW